MEWKEVRLGDIADVQTGPFGSQLHKSDYIAEGIPCIMPTNIGSHLNFIVDGIAHVSEVDANRLSRHLTEFGDIIYARRGDIEKCAYVTTNEEKWLCGTGCLKIRCNNGVNSRFIAYQLSTAECKKWITGNAVGTTMLNLSKGILSNLPLLVPSHEDQRRIASILSSLDRKIELNNKINADLEEMAQAIFKNWFVDFEPFKDGKFVDSELGMIPEGWKVGRLTDVIKLMPGGTPKTSEPLYWDNGTIPFFSPKDVNGVYCFATEKHITETGLNKCSSNLYPKDTIFITCRGTVGKVCLAACDMAMNQSNYAIKAIDGYSQYYVFFLVKSVVERLIKKSNGAVFSAITSKDFDEEILIPSQKAVEDFTNMIDGFFRRIFTIGTENSRLSLLRDTLLPRLMSGELEVPE
ncbi:restriction endonuclease subunit S [Segatella copri]|uniref:Restriction endonuclease subunit S n=1 Tax=Segatella copri TaxID=165179 RepID=A0A3R6DWJ0_9BACT|nr:restriction endonuclease subunit S [Segatella copri]RHG35686.1 restriction endonuclease subunit S [Segatella copri]RHG36429.1 restriction endonuclease subunit S [Segatella copri]RHG66185.1 restriction endonuclease subunit S [Segatella copri]